MSASASADFLTHIGLPKCLAEHIRQAWRTERWIQYGDHTHHSTLQHSAVPQGCPLAPLTLACWMLAGQNSVKSQLVDAGFLLASVDALPFLSYMDDRTWIGKDLAQSAACVTAWKSFSDLVGFKENENKTLACAKTRRGQEQLQEEHPEWCRQRDFSVLGTCIATGPRQNTAKESGRVQLAVKRTHLIKVLPLPYSAKLSLFRKLALPVASFGWGARMPPKATCNALFNTLTAVLGRNKMASPLIRSVIYVGTVHLRPVLLQRLFARVCRLRMANPPCRWGKQPGTQVAKLRVILKDDAWQEEGPWRWFHPVSRLRLVIPAAAGKADLAHGAHQLREAWRGATFDQMGKGGLDTKLKLASLRMPTFAMQSSISLSLSLCSHLDYMVVFRTFTPALLDRHGHQ